MNFARLGSNLVWNSNSNSFLTRGRHVAFSYWLVPVRLDRWCEPLDLMRSARLRLIDLASVKWSLIDHWIQIQWCRWKGSGSSLIRVPVRSSAARVRLGGWLRWGSGPSRGWGTGGRGSACRGGVGGVVLIIGLVQQRGEGAAGGDTDVGGSGGGWFRQCATNLDKPEVSQRAPKREEEFGIERSAWAHRWSPDLSWNICRYPWLRRGISPAWRLLWRRERRGIGEEEEGVK
jgi:hypothetical protein